MSTLPPTETPPAAAQRSILEPMNLHNPIEFNELLRQRVLCGWEFTPSAITAWRLSADAGTLSNFWIVPSTLSHLPSPQRWAGHISMASKTYGPPETSTPVRHIANLFVVPERRLGGLGRQAVQALEAWARSEGVETMTLNAISRRYIEDDADEWRGFYLRYCERNGIEKPEKGTTNEDWYVRQGYVKYGEEPMYEAVWEGEKFKFLATLLRKKLV